MNIKLLNETAKIPTRGSEYAAGYDMYACGDGDYIIEPGDTVMVSTGIAAEIPTGCFGALFARSGLATKKGLRPANCVGVIDSDYRGEIMVAMYNDSDKQRVIEPGERIAQLVFLPYESFDINVVDELDDTQRGSGGFGSTGVK